MDRSGACRGRGTESSCGTGAEPVVVGGGGVGTSVPRRVFRVRRCDVRVSPVVDGVRGFDVRVLPVRVEDVGGSPACGTAVSGAAAAPRSARTRPSRSGERPAAVRADSSSSARVANSADRTARTACRFRVPDPVVGPDSRGSCVVGSPGSATARDASAPVGASARADATSWSRGRRREPGREGQPGAGPPGRGGDDRRDDRVHVGPHGVDETAEVRGRLHGVRLPGGPGVTRVVVGPVVGRPGPDRRRPRRRAGTTGTGTNGSTTTAGGTGRAASRRARTRVPAAEARNATPTSVQNPATASWYQGGGEESSTSWTAAAARDTSPRTTAVVGRVVSCHHGRPGRERRITERTSRLLVRHPDE